MLDFLRRQSAGAEIVASVCTGSALLARVWGEDTARTAASYTEYNWHRDADDDPFAAELNLLARQLGML